MVGPEKKLFLKEKTNISHSDIFSGYWLLGDHNRIQDYKLGRQFAQ